MMDIKQALSLFITTCFICTRAVYSQRPEQLSVVHISGNIVVTWQPPNSRNRVKYFKILITYPNGRRIEVNATETRYMLPVHNAVGIYLFSVIAKYDPSGSSGWSSTESITITPGTIEPVPVAKISDPFHFDEPAVGKDHTLRCTVANSNVVNRSYRYRWKINNEIIETSKDRYSLNLSRLTIGMVTKQDKNMAIQCQVESGSRQSNFSSVVVLNPRYGPSNVIIIPRRLRIIKDKNGQLSLHCSSDCHPHCRYTWYHKPKTLNKHFLFHTLGKDLSIKRVQPNHAGTFACTVTSPDGDIENRTLSRSIQLSVNYGPDSVNVSPGRNPYHYDAIEGKTFSPINCNADCIPKCSFKWRFRNVTDDVFRNFQNSSVLNIATVERANAGFYKCVARNRLKRKSAVISVTVHYGPIGVSVSPFQTVMTRKEGIFVGTIKCSAECGRQCSYIWKKDFMTIRNNGFIFNKTVYVSDKGNYTCYVQNSYTGQVRASRSFVMDILHGPKNVHVLVADNSTADVLRTSRGSTIKKLYCKADCNPGCNYKWTSSSKRITQNGQILDLGTATSDKNGTYTCTAANVYDSSTYEVIVLVEEYGIKLSNSSAFLHSPYFVVEGSPLRLNCHAKCKIVYCQFRWDIVTNTRDRRHPVYRSALHYGAVTRRQSGTYICYDIFEKRKETLQVKVQYGPAIKYVRSIDPSGNDENNVEIKKENNMKLECNVDSIPTANITWKKFGNGNTQVVRTDNSLYVKEEIECEDSGTYICEADNGIGVAAQSNITVYVRCPPHAVQRKRSMTKSKFKKKLDSNVIFKAEATGYPPVVAKWFYRYNNTSTEIELNPSEQNITSTDDVFSFYIHKITEENYGLYILELSNEEGNLSLNFALEPEAIVTSPDDLRPGTRNGSSLGTFIGAVVAGIAFLCLVVIALVVIMMRKRNKSRKEISPEPEGFSRDSSGQFDQDEDHYSQVSKVKTRKQTENTSASNAYDNTTYLLDSNINTNTDQPQEYNVELHKRNSYTYAQVQKRQTVDSKETEEFQVLPVGDEKLSGNDNDVCAKVVKKPAQENGKAGGHEKEKTTIKRQRAGGKRKKSSAEKQKSKTEEAMNYVELDLQSQTSEAGGTAKFVIHGVENRTTYSLVDFTKHAEPLPENENSDIPQGSEEQNLEEQSGEQTLDSTENDNKC